MTFSVLFIDDDEQFKKLLELRLRAILGEFSLKTFADLTAARKFLAQNSDFAPDLIFLDEHLPDGRGVSLLQEGHFADLAVLSVSSDTDPEIPGAVIQAGATYFLNKRQVSEALFRPLVLGIIDRNRLQRQLTAAKVNQVKLQTVQTLVSTLRHEINNPLGAVLGAAYILRNNPAAAQDQIEAAELVEKSGQRIKHVVEQLCAAFELDAVNKAAHKVFHIPGDAPWEKD